MAAYLSYTFFVYTSGTETAFKMSAAAQEGKKVFQDNNCIACHQLYGLGGYMGPDLTNVISSRGELYVRSFIENGTAKMPDFELNKPEVDALVAYLGYVDSSANFPNRSVELTWYGTVNNSTAE
ncbi:MAG: cytochrome c [Bacteroidetes bacterium]|nr:cytochrome c [Bacteroidota bacterium]